MLLDTTGHVSLLDRFIARYEISRLTVLGPSVLLFTGAPVSFVSWLVTITGNRSIARWNLALLAIWLIVTSVDTGRYWWTQRHLGASLRWLRAVRVVAGNDVFDLALQQLTWRQVSQPDYVVGRRDLLDMIRLERGIRRDAARRADGVQLAEIIATGVDGAASR